MLAACRSKYSSLETCHRKRRGPRRDRITGETASESGGGSVLPRPSSDSSSQARGRTTCVAIFSSILPASTSTHARVRGARERGARRSRASAATYIDLTTDHDGAVTKHGLLHGLLTKLGLLAARHIVAATGQHACMHVSLAPPLPTARGCRRYRPARMHWHVSLAFPPPTARGWRSSASQSRRGCSLLTSSDQTSGGEMQE